MDSDKVKNLIQALEARNISAEYHESLEKARERILELIPGGCSVGIGHSITLEAMSLTKVLTGLGFEVFDKTMGKNKSEVKSLKKKALLADWYVTGTNALSEQGHIVNIDHSGNRVAAMLYGPDKVIIVVGTNKIATSLEDAIARARNVAAPLNARRAGLQPPCMSLNRCVDCRSIDRACNSLVIIEGQYEKGRVRVLIVGEEAGY